MKALMIVTVLGSFALAGWCQGVAMQPGMPQPGGMQGQPGMPPGGMNGPGGPGVPGGMGMPGMGGGMPGMGMGMPGMGMGMPGMGGGMPNMQFPPQQFAPVMMIVDGVVYVAFDGRLTAFEAKTLKKLGEAVYSDGVRTRARAGQGQGAAKAAKPGQAKPNKAGGPVALPAPPPAPGAPQ
jgi:hypothetical protein